MHNHISKCYYLIIAHLPKSMSQIQTQRTILWTFSPTGHLLVKGNLNNYEALWIIDTGANYTCIDLQSAENKVLPLTLSDELASGVGNSTIARYETTIERLYIGDFLLEARPVAAIDLTHVNEILLLQGTNSIDGVIGNDILRQFNAIINYAEQTLTLFV